MPDYRVLDETRDIFRERPSRYTARAYASEAWRLWHDDEFSSDALNGVERELSEKGYEAAFKFAVT